MGEKNELNIPNGKNVYTLLLNIPETFGSGEDAKVTIIPSKSKGLTELNRTISRSGLIPLDSEGNLETDKIKTDRPCVFVPYNREFTSRGIIYLGENTESRVLYFIDEKAKESTDTPIVFTNKDGQEESFYLDIKNKVLPKMDAILNKRVLQAEKDYYNFNGYDADETGYFHVVFCDFGEKMTEYYGKLSAGGTVGFYAFAHIRDYSSENAETNGADMFFVNIRYIEYCTKNFYAYMHAMHSSSEKMMDGDRDMMSPDYFVDDVCKEITETFLHEYMHYLMDSNIYLNHKEGKGKSSVLIEEKTPLFWAEGTAESTATLFTEEKNLNGHLEFVLDWIQNANAFAPYIGEGREKGYEEHNSLSYGVAPMFFLFIRDVYGEDVFKKCCTYTETKNNLNTIIQECVGKTFSELYREFIIRLFASAAGDTNYGTSLSFLEEWSISKNGLFSEYNYVPAVNDNSTRLVSAEQNVIFDEGTVNIADGCISLIKWEDKPDVITLTSDSENIEAYVLYI